MKKLITVIIIFFSLVNLCAQRRSTDSLKLLLSKEKTDTGRVNLLGTIGARFGFGMKKNDSSLWYLQRALDLSKKINYTKGEFLAEQHIAYYLFQTGNYSEALKLSLQNVKKAQLLNDKGYLFDQTRLVIWIYNSIGNYKMALQYGMKLKSLASSLNYNDPLNIPYNAIANNNLAKVFEGLNQLDSALHYYYLINSTPPDKKRLSNAGICKEGPW